MHVNEKRGNLSGLQTVLQSLGLMRTIGWSEDGGGATWWVTEVNLSVS